MLTPYQYNVLLHHDAPLKQNERRKNNFTMPINDQWYEARTFLSNHGYLTLKKLAPDGWTVFRPTELGYHTLEPRETLR